MGRPNDEIGTMGQSSLVRLETLSKTSLYCMALGFFMLLAAFACNTQFSRQALPAWPLVAGSGGLAEITSHLRSPLHTSGSSDKFRIQTVSAIAHPCFAPAQFSRGARRPCCGGQGARH